MKLFDFLKNIIADKREHTLDINEEVEYIPFLLNRYISFYSDDYSYIVNNTVNINSRNNTNKQHHYDFLRNLLPKKRNKFIKYIKKNKKDKDNIDYERYARYHELSKREIMEYNRIFELDLREKNNK